MTFTADQVRDMQRRTEGTLNEMLGAYAALVEASAWRDISTAPKDGTPVLACRSEGAMTMTRPVVCEWSDRHTTSGIKCWNDTEYSYAPTHWQPLPPAPSATGAGR